MDHGMDWCQPLNNKSCLPYCSSVLADTIIIIVLQTQAVKCLSRIRKIPKRNSVATSAVLARSVCLLSVPPGKCRDKT